MIQNGIPQLALIVETIVTLFVVSLSINLLVRYREKRRSTTLYLTISIFGYGMAVLSSVIGKYIDYFSSVSREVISYSGFTINIAYSSVAIANIFLYLFIENVYLDQNEGRILIITIFSGIIVGLILGSNSLEDGAYSNSLYYLIAMIMVSSYIYVRLLRLSLREASQSENTVVKMGFRFIGLFGLFALLMFLMFIIDLILIQFGGEGYSVFYYLAWTSGGLACLSGYLGYVNPTWFRNLVGGST